MKKQNACDGEPFIIYLHASHIGEIVLHILFHFGKIQSMYYYYLKQDQPI